MSKSEEARKLLARNEIHRIDIARRVGLTHGAVSKIAKAMGIPRLPRPDRIVPENVEEIYEREGSIRKAARVCGVTSTAFYRALVRARRQV